MKNGFFSSVNRDMLMRGKRSQFKVKDTSRALNKPKKIW